MPDFRSVSPKVDFSELDNKWLAFWRERKIFEKSQEIRKGGPSFVFYEGPPTANGMPHPGHVLTRVTKDVFPRYRSMCGYHVPRRAGWDTHGLPVEVEVEKDLGIHGREAIENYGIEAFADKCISSVFKYSAAWQRMSERVGFWVDFDNAYVTYHKDYVQSVWWALKSLFDRGLLYQGYKVVWWWPQGGTALSAGEVGQGYKKVDDPSIFVRFPVVGQEGVSFLAWTTTPWTLPSNIALAVSNKEDYATVELEGGERVVLAEKLIPKILGKVEHIVVETKTGAEWVGASYKPPFDYEKPEGGPAYQVIAADFVTMDTGSGMVHLAPAFGEDDFRACKEQGLGFLQLVKPDGTFVPAVTDFAGRFCKEADRDIIRNLKSRELLFREEVYRHDYPYCWRAMDDPLIQYARKSWFIRTTQEIDKVIDNNSRIHWQPEHIRDGRMGAFLRTNVDWALSRERFWGTPLPIWINDETGAMESVDSAEEILKKNPNAFDEFRVAQEKNPELADHLMVHKPWIDNVTWQNEGEPGTYRRVPEVIDCWFDSGCMPFAQWGYPHKNQEQFAETYPADFISEGVDQTRGWFYSLMTIGTLLFGKEDWQDKKGNEVLPRPFRNCVVLGLLTDKKGKKMSKRDRNYADPLELIEEHGADSIRWALYANTAPGQGTKFDGSSPVEAKRELLLKLWNVYSFFVTYAQIDGWTPSDTPPALEARHDLDRWILAELDATTARVREAMDDYRSDHAVRAIVSFSDALSNWYVRRNRSRFWSEDDTPTKQAAFSTLYEVLVEFVRILAPFVPFMSDEIHENLMQPIEGAPESVHLADYPVSSEARANSQLREQVGLVREVVALGQRVRTENKIKIRQPLGKAIVVVHTDQDRDALMRFETDIAEELNVLSVEFTTEPGSFVDFDLVPNFKVLGKKLGKRMKACQQALRQADGSALHDRMEQDGKITLSLEDGPLELGPEDVEVRLVARDDYAAAASHGQVVILEIKVSSELRRAGLAREVVNRIQRLRKDLDLPFEARIELGYETAGELADAIEEHKTYIAKETLSESMKSAKIDGATSHTTQVDETELRLWLAQP